MHISAILNDPPTNENGSSMIESSRLNLALNRMTSHMQVVKDR